MTAQSADRGLRLDIVGAGPAYTDRPGATGAAYLVRHAGTAILLDLGQGSFPRLAGLIDPGELDAILISHLHPDHFIDLVALRHYLRWGPVAGRRVRVLAPAGLADRLDWLHDEPGFTATVLDVETLVPGAGRIGSLSVEVRQVAHTSASYAFRVDDGRAGLVYSGDCGRSADLDPLVRRGDALLAEVTFGPGPVPPDVTHLDGPGVGALAVRTGAARVLLTHLLMGFDPDATVDSVRALYPGPVSLVDPGDSFLIEG